jgi:hypothetical protein
MWVTTNSTRIAFDWLEEGACCECKVEVEDGCLVWTCDDCPGGRAELRTTTEVNL